jgi:hypothetical protein
MHKIKTILIAIAIVVTPIISFNCTDVAAGGRNFNNHRGYVRTVQDISSSAGSIEINSKFAGKGAIGKKEKYPGNKHWRRKKEKCTDKKCRRNRKRKYTGNNYWGTRGGYRDEYIIVVEAKGNEEEDREKEKRQEEERMREEQRIREERTRKDLERINQEDWFR